MCRVGEGDDRWIVGGGGGPWARRICPPSHAHTQSHTHAHAHTCTHTHTPPEESEPRRLQSTDASPRSPVNLFSSPLPLFGTSSEAAACSLSGTGGGGSGRAGGTGNGRSLLQLTSTCASDSGSGREWYATACSAQMLPVLSAEGVLAMSCGDDGGANTEGARASVDGPHDGARFVLIAFARSCSCSSSKKRSLALCARCLLSSSSAACALARSAGALFGPTASPLSARGTCPPVCGSCGGLQTAWSGVHAPAAVESTTTLPESVPVACPSAFARVRLAAFAFALYASTIALYTPISWDAREPTPAAAAGAFLHFFGAAKRTPGALSGIIDALSLRLIRLLSSSSFHTARLGGSEVSVRLLKQVG